MTSTPEPSPLHLPAQPAAQLPLKMAIQPTAGEVITSLRTGISYTVGEKIGEGFFGIVYACQDQWENELAAKVLKPLGKPYETVRASAEAEILKLLALRHPNITYIYDAFEYRDTFYIITERCFCPVSHLFSLKDFNGFAWLMPIARCLLQAVHYLHVNGVVHQDIHAGNVFTSFAKDEMKTEPGQSTSSWQTLAWLNFSPKSTRTILARIGCCRLKSLTPRNLVQPITESTFTTSVCCCYSLLVRGN